MTALVHVFLIIVLITINVITLGRSDSSKVPLPTAVRAPIPTTIEPGTPPPVHDNSWHGIPSSILVFRERSMPVASPGYNPPTYHPDERVYIRVPPTSTPTPVTSV